VLPATVENHMSFYRSENLNELFAALSKSQAEMELAGLVAENPFFKSKYAPFKEIVRASRSALTKNGLAVSQIINTEEDGNTYLYTVLCHSSGQWIEGKLKLTPAKTDAQSLGSYITYLKRYAYSALVGVVVGDDDDDAESDYHRGHNVPKNISVNDKITAEQLELIEMELENHLDLASDIMNKMNIKTLKDIPKNYFNSAIKRIREIKSAMGAV
jgi:ERF superfamily protein